MRPVLQERSTALIARIAKCLNARPALRMTRRRWAVSLDAGLAFKQTASRRSRPT